MEKKTPLKKRLLLAVKLLLSFAAVFIIYKKVDLSQVAAHLGSANWWWLVAAFVVFFISKAISAVRLNLFYKCHQVRLSEKQNLFLYLLGMFYNLFVPLVGGEAYKIYRIHRQQQTPVKQLVWASLNDRLSGFVWLSVFALLFFIISPTKMPYKQACWLAIPVGILSYYLFIRFFFTSYLPVFTKSNILSFMVQGTQILCSYCVLLAMGVHMRIAEYLFIFTLSCYAYTIPFIGAREMAFVFGAEMLGLDKSLSLAISLYFYAAMAITSFAGIVFLFFPELLEGEESEVVAVQAS